MINFAVGAICLIMGGIQLLLFFVSVIDNQSQLDKDDVREVQKIIALYFIAAAICFK